MFPFAGGIVAGKLFDKGYFRPVVMTGSVILLFSLFMLSLAKEGQYYQVRPSFLGDAGPAETLILGLPKPVSGRRYWRRANSCPDD